MARIVDMMQVIEMWISVGEIDNAAVRLIILANIAVTLVLADRMITRR